MTNTATRIYLVGVIERAIAYYEVEAEDARSAAENWQDGEFHDRDDEALDSEGPCNVRVEQSDGTWAKLPPSEWEAEPPAAAPALAAQATSSLLPNLDLTNTEPTSGPWVYTLDARGVCGIHGGDNAKAPVRIGEVTADTHRQAEANARLITAAPAQAVILALVQQGVMTLAEGEAEFDGVMYWFNARQPDWCVAVVNAIGWDAARAAIAEAKAA